MAPPGSWSSARLRLVRAVPLSPQVPQPGSPCCSHKSFFFFPPRNFPAPLTPQQLLTGNTASPSRPIPSLPVPSRSPYLAAGGAAPRRRGGRRGARPAPGPPPSQRRGGRRLPQLFRLSTWSWRRRGAGGARRPLLFLPGLPGSRQGWSWSHRAGGEGEGAGGPTERPPPRTPPTRAGRPKPHPAWPRAPPGMGRPRLLWQPSASAPVQ